MFAINLAVVPVHSLCCTAVHKAMPYLKTTMKGLVLTYLVLHILGMGCIKNLVPWYYSIIAIPSALYD